MHMIRYNIHTHTHAGNLSW